MDQIHRHAATADDEGRRLDRVLADALDFLSRSRISALIQSGYVSEVAAGTVTDPAHKVRAGQIFATVVPQVVEAQPKGENISLSVAYEDEDIVVIDKPAGMVVHPGAGNSSGTLVNALIAHCGTSLSGIGGERRPGIVHRIDKDTSGVIVVAKNDFAHACLAAQFAEHRLERAYTAVLWGVPLPTTGTVEGNIARSPHHRQKMAVVAAPKGRRAVTHYRVMRPLDRRASVVDLRLETGRTHQIRVHMASVGHAVVGDPVYGRGRQGRIAGLSEDAQARITGFRRQALHARLLGFRHPRDGRAVRFESPLPQDMLQLIADLSGAP